MKLVCLSDTHGRHREVQVPAGDVLIHAGDFTRRGRAEEIADFNDWLATLPHEHKLVIAGNHDFLFEREPQRARELLTGAIYLEDSGTEIAGLNFWGSPVSPRFFDWAFNRSRGAEIHSHWHKIPAATHVLITHTPPQGCLDRVWLGKHVGCEALRQELEQRLNPILLVCGHIHESAGQEQLGSCTVVNASSLNRRYRHTQAVWTVAVEPETARVLSCTAHQIGQTIG